MSLLAFLRFVSDYVFVFKNVTYSIRKKNGLKHDLSYVLTNGMYMKSYTMKLNS